MPLMKLDCNRDGVRVERTSGYRRSSLRNFTVTTRRAMCLEGKVWARCAEAEVVVGRMSEFKDTRPIQFLARPLIRVGMRTTLTSSAPETISCADPTP
jgi:hypothetical protein